MPIDLLLGIASVAAIQPACKQYAQNRCRTRDSDEECSIVPVEYTCRNNSASSFTIHISEEKSVKSETSATLPKICYAWKQFFFCCFTLRNTIWRSLLLISSKKTLQLAHYITNAPLQRYCLEMVSQWRCQVPSRYPRTSLLECLKIRPAIRSYVEVFMKIQYKI